VTRKAYASAFTSNLVTEVRSFQTAPIIACLAALSRAAGHIRRLWVRTHPQSSSISSGSSMSQLSADSGCNVAQSA
jgi:hypothetical protein